MVFRVNLPVSSALQEISGVETGGLNRASRWGRLQDESRCRAVSLVGHDILFRRHYALQRRVQHVRLLVFGAFNDTRQRVHV